LNLSCLALNGVKFPSPCGEKVGINDIYLNPLDVLQMGVSVPLRGKGRDQRLNLSCLALNGVKFPSPCGEKVGINLKPALLMRMRCSMGFRPLAGKR